MQAPGVSRAASPPGSSSRSPTRRTAADLVRIGGRAPATRGAALTALGIVEVPEGMPLSEGATRARQARRLLQRVLDFAPPRGRRSTRSSASAGAPRRGSSRSPPRRTPTSSSSAGAGPAATRRERSRRGSRTLAAPRSRRRPPRPEGRARAESSRPRSTRSCATRRATSRSSSSAARRRCAGSSSPVRGGPHAELALRFADALARAPRRRRGRPPRRPARLERGRPAQAERALDDVRPPARARTGRAARPRGVERPRRHPARGRARRPRRHGRLGRRRWTGTSASLFGALPEAIASGRRRTVIVVRTREQIDARDVRGARRAAPRRSRPPSARPRRRRRVPARVDRWFGESNFHHAEFADLERLVELKEKQGLTISLVLPDPQRGGDDRADRARGATRADGAGPARRRAPGHRLRVDRRHPRDRRGARARAWSCTRDVLPALRLASAGKGEALWKSLYETTGDIVVWCRHGRPDWHPRMVYGTLGPLLDGAAHRTT